MSMPPGGYPGDPRDPWDPRQGGAPEQYGGPGQPGGAPGHQAEGPGQWGPPAGSTPGQQAGSPGAQHGGPGQPYGPPAGPGPEPFPTPRAAEGAGQFGAPGQFAGPGQFGAGGPQFGGPGAGWPAPEAGRSRRTPLVLAVAAVLMVALSVVAWAVTRGGGDPKAQADKFMSAVQHGDFSGAKGLLCKDGKDQFSDINEMREKLAGGDISGYTIGDVSDNTFEGDKRKEVQVSVRLADGTSDSVTLSMTRESGKYLVCGF